MARQEDITPGARVRRIHPGQAAAVLAVKPVGSPDQAVPPMKLAIVERLPHLIGEA